MINDYKYHDTKNNMSPCWKCWAISVLLLLIILKLLYVPSVSTPPQQSIIHSSTKNGSINKPYQYTFYYTLPSESNLIISDTEINTRSREQLFNKKKPIKYSIQAGSFKSVTEAIKHQKKIKTLGFKAILEKQTLGNTVWNRVKLGPYSITEVKNNKEKLRQHGIDVLVIEIEKST